MTFQQSERVWNWLWFALSLGHVGVGIFLGVPAYAGIAGFLAGAFFTRATGFGMPRIGER